MNLDNTFKFHQVNIDDHTALRFNLMTGKIHINNKTYIIKKGVEIVNANHAQFMDIQKMTTLALKIVHREMDIKNLKKMTIDEHEIHYFSQEEQEGTIDLTNHHHRIKEEEEIKFKKLFKNITNPSDKEDKIKKLLTDAFGTEKMKLTVEETINHLTDEYISPTDLKNETPVYYHHEKYTKQKMVKRLAIYALAGLDLHQQSPSLFKRKASTGYDIPILKDIEKAFKKSALSPQQKATITALEKHKITVIISGKNVLIEEKEVGLGAFKLITSASDYFSMKSPDERNSYVTLKLRPKQKKELTSLHQQSQDIEEVNIHECQTLISKSEASDKTMIHWGVREILPLKDVPFEKLSLEQMKERLEDLQHKLSSEKPILTVQDDISYLEKCIVNREKDNDILNTFHEMNEQEEFAYEINLTKKFAGEGVVDVHNIIDLATKDKIMVQESAGFKLQNGTTVIDLDRMRKMHHDRLLTREETIKMMEIFLQALRGVVRLHHLGYIHRDLKEENILITKEGRGVLSDFGTAVKKKDDPIKSRYSGTIRYSAPETLKYDRQEQWNLIDEKCDVWSCGMILQNLFVEGGLSAHPAVDHKIPCILRELNRELDTAKNKKKYEQNYPEPQDKISFEHLVWEATKIDPKERPTITEFYSALERIIERQKKF